MRSVGLRDREDYKSHQFPNTCSFCRRVMKHVFLLCSWTLHSKEKNAPWLILSLFSSLHLAKSWSSRRKFHCRCHPTQSQFKKSWATLAFVNHIYYCTSTAREHVQTRWQSLTWAPCIHVMGIGRSAATRHYCSRAQDLTPREFIADMQRGSWSLHKDAQRAGQEANRPKCFRGNSIQTQGDVAHYEKN